MNSTDKSSNIMQFGKDTIAQAASFHQSNFLYRSEEFPGSKFLESLQAEVESGRVLFVENQQSDTAIYYRHLPWDSEYFETPTYRIEFLTSSRSRDSAIREYRLLLDRLIARMRSAHDRLYVFSEVPSQAIDPIQSLCLSGWKMVETRLMYYNDALQRYDYPHRFPVRAASLDDIPNLREVASSARNNFDRFHSDCFFSLEIADEFLATFVENSVKGFADVTLVPDLDANEPGAFLTGNFVAPTEAPPDAKIAKMVLSAVGGKRRGWYVKLISEMSYFFKDRGIDVCYMATQSTNKAVIRTWEKLGYSYGKSSHVFAYASEGTK